jgi:glycosyltransferase involved in cell wall biosynthesis
VKEADALSAAGHEVTVLAALAGPWPRALDEALLASRCWTCRYVGGSPDREPVRLRLTRLRHGLARRAARWGSLGEILAPWTGGRVLPELLAAARNTRADLYIGHNLEALPAAVEAARATGAAAGYDCEDFLPGMEPPGVGSRRDVENVTRLERAYLPRCDYLTAASPGIAEAYERMYGVRFAACILNVFPLSLRPAEFRPSSEGPLTLTWFSQTVGPYRGLEQAIEALALAGRDIRLHLRGTWARGFERRLFALARQAGVSADRIVYRPPVESADGVVQLSAAHDVGLALEEPASVNRDVCLTNKLFTYLLAGNAVAMTATVAQRALAAELDEAVFCYEPGDVRTLAALLRRWYDDRSALDRARRLAWEWGAQRYNWDLECARFLAVVEPFVTPAARFPAPKEAAR